MSAARPGREKRVPMAELARAVARLLNRCKRTKDGCLLAPPTKQVPQIRARIMELHGIVLSAPRAVYVVSTGMDIPPDHQVHRTCARLRCLEPTHLTPRLPSDLVPAARERHLRAQREAMTKRRKWSAKDCARLLALAGRMGSVAAAAQQMDIPHATAYALLRRGRTPKHGGHGSEICSRCGETGHRRSSLDCPDRAEART